MPLDATTFAELLDPRLSVLRQPREEDAGPECTHIAPAYDKEMRCMTSIIIVSACTGTARCLREVAELLPMGSLTLDAAFVALQL